MLNFSYAIILSTALMLILIQRNSFAFYIQPDMELKEYENSFIIFSKNFLFVEVITQI